MRSIRALRFLSAISVLVLVSLACATTPVQSSATSENSAPVVETSPAVDSAPPLGEVILEDQFVDNSNNWLVDTDQYRQATIADGKYQIRITDAGYNWFYGPVAVSDVDITVDTEFVEGVPANTDYGVLCRVKDTNNHYRFLIASDGVYRIDKLVNNESSAIIDWTGSKALRTGTGVINTIRAICKGDHLTLYVNDSLVADVVDSSLEGGNYALMAGAYTGSDKVFTPAVVNFSNLTVRKP
jgi:hypothetical protein